MGKSILIIPQEEDTTEIGENNNNIFRLKNKMLILGIVIETIRQQ